MDTAFANECEALADEVMTAINKYAIIDHPEYGKIYAYEVDGYGSILLMDDANVPGLLSLPYIDCVSSGDEIYQSVTLTEAGETPGRVSYSLNNTTFTPTGITFGNIAVGANATFYVKVTVQASATAGRQNFSFNLSGESI